jgi:hypothetical protein
MKRDKKMLHGELKGERTLAVASGRIDCRHWTHVRGSC